LAPLDYTILMLISGRIHNGVVTLQGEISLPEGMEVTVVAPAAPGAVGDALSEAERRRVLDIMDRIAALPVEGSTEPFSGANHDRVLYAKP
jgi:hypothetical protein